MASDPALLRLDAASHSYDGAHWQFRDLDFTLAAGEVTAILGINGRGKSTLLRVLGGLQKPTSGAQALHPRTGIRAAGFLPLLPLYGARCGADGAGAACRAVRTPGKADIDMANAALEATGMADLAGRSIMSLSGGQRQLVLIARALAGENAVLLLDEPASALDLRNQDIVLTLLGRLADAQGLAIAFTTHQPNHAMAVADKVLLMLEEGRALFGATDEVMTEAALGALYGIPVRTVHMTGGAAFVPVFRQRARAGAPAP